MLLSLPGALIPAVCSWFAENGRPLPWRNAPEADPYHVWLSEIMLQQTRIEAVIPYFERFLAACPDIPSLAAIDDGLLLKLWEGLGYYCRARNLKKAAVILVRDHGGKLPPDAALLRKLPGIGEYTAGAVASVAFGLPEPAVDGNVLRVLSRVCAMEDDVLLPAVRKAVAEELRKIYPAGRDAALFTEGLMEIGEVLCIPNGSPACGSCPLRPFCRAAAEGTTDRYPVRSPKKERRVEQLTVFLLRTGDGRYLIRRRPPAGLLGGLWEFPNLPGHIRFSDAPLSAEDGQLPLFPASGQTADAAPSVGPSDVSAVLAVLLPPDMVPELGTSIPVPLGEAVHLFTHVEWRMTGYGIDLPGTAAPPADGGGSYVFAAPEEIRDTYAVPTAFRAWTKKLR